MVGWHHQLDGHEFEQAPGVGDGTGKPSVLQSIGHKESDTTERAHTHTSLLYDINRTVPSSLSFDIDFFPPKQLRPIW